ncbi:hypothetical protein GCM10022291_13250 [Postechiella marina]|uniref:Uncharacterized protein n=2 Tax=Postechiella marina TaxID=943941 RepID=A0ABP8C5V5_9FLAO
MIASMILNNLFSNSIRSNTRLIDAHLNELQYLYINDNLQLPYSDDYNSWEVTINSYTERESTIVLIEAFNRNINKTITKRIVEN